MDEKAIKLLCNVFKDDEYVQECVLWVKIEHGDGGYKENTEMNIFFNQISKREAIINYLDGEIGNHETNKVLTDIVRSGTTFPLQFIYDEIESIKNIKNINKPLKLNMK